MPSIQVCNPRPRPFRWWGLGLRFSGKFLSPPALLSLWLLLAGLGAFLPGMFTGHRMAVAVKDWEGESHEVGKAVVKAWTHALPPVAFTKGEEPALRQWLGEEPLVHALVDPARGEVWIREGRRLRSVPPAQAEEAARLLRWARQAQASGQISWIPPANDHPRAKSEAILALATGRWWEFKQWVPSSPATEQFLDRFTGSGAFFRFAITRYDRDPKIGRKNTEGTALPPAGSRVPTFASMFPDLSLAFGEPWVAGLWGTPAQTAIMEHKVRTWNRMAWSAYGGFVTLLALGCLLHLYISRRDRLRADQLAFLAHSLKTPLTVLKLRCDTVRNANLPKAVQDSQVARIGDEVDKLVKIIEAGLESVRPEAKAPAPDLIDAAFFRRFQEQLEPIFAGEHRALELLVPDLAFKAPARALWPALNTLLENALIHGKGTATIRVRRQRKGVEIQVWDEGSGIPADKLSALVGAGGGRTWAPPPLGHGVGIFLLHQMAVHEGWGLRFDSVGEGFAAVLEIPA